MSPASGIALRPGTRAPGTAPGLAAGQLGTRDLTVSTVANIGPGIDFYFAFGVIAVTAGVAAPLTIVAAGIAVVFLAAVVAEFTRAEPSAGSITYVESGLGARAGVVTALLVSVGYTVAMAGVFTMSGGMVTTTLDHYTSVHVPWEPVSVVLSVAAIWVTAKGVKLSTSAVGVALVAQVAVMLAVCMITLIDQSGHLSAVPFSPSHISGGLSGLSRGFPPLGRLRSETNTPVNALIAMAAVGLGIIGVWSLTHVISGNTRSMNPVGLYAECSTMGTIVILIVYLLTNFSLPLFMWRRHRARFSVLRHVAVPAVGSAVLIVPFIELCAPGQPSPYNSFPFLALALLVLAVIAAGIVVHRNPPRVERRDPEASLDA